MTKVLIIDDDPDIVLVERTVLEHEGYEVVSARNRTDGLQKVEQEHPDLIVLDVMLDTATAGFQMALDLRNPDPASSYAPYSKIPILMMTSIHDTTNLRFEPDDMYLPVDAFMPKPVDPKKFAEKVRELLSKS